MSTNTASLYDHLESRITKLIASIQEATIENKELAEAQQYAGVVLNNLQSEINTEYQQLKINSEWHTFTIAFYGETNAGKSTIIETLRILLNEKTKQESQRRFKEFQAQNKITHESFENIRKIILAYDNEINKHKEQLMQFNQKYDQNSY